MAKKKSCGLELTPEKAAAFGVMTPDELAKVVRPSMEVLRRIDEAEQRRLASAARQAGRLPPPSNTGGKSDDGSDDSVRLVLEGGEVKQIPKRRGWGGDAAFVDWLNFTIGEETIVNDDEIPSPDHVMIAMSNRLINIFGFGITSKREKGANFYRESWVIGDNWGMVCHGGQRHTILVMLSGSGCAAALEGWEKRLVDFLQGADRARLTRVDFAHDDYEGSTYSVDRADADHTSGLFNCGGRHPDCEHRGNWKFPNGKGRTLNVGNRTNGKFCRVYEKGRQLGDSESPWVRIEVEFKSVDRVIPFDCLLRPGEYLAASYPAFSWISAHQERILTTQKTCVANVDRAVKWVRHQCGSTIREMVALFGVSEFLQKVIRPDGLPAWAKVPRFDLSPEPIQKAPGLSLSYAAATVAF